MCSHVQQVVQATMNSLVSMTQHADQVMLPLCAGWGCASCPEVSTEYGFVTGRQPHSHRYHPTLSEALQALPWDEEGQDVIQTREQPIKSSGHFQILHGIRLLRLSGEDYRQGGTAIQGHC